MAMINCKEALDQCHAYLDQQLEPHKHSEVDLHLSACPGCANGFTEERSFHTLLKTKLNAAVPSSAPESLRQRITAQLQNRPAVQAKIEHVQFSAPMPLMPMKRLHGTVGLAASFMLGLSGLFMFQSSCVNKQCPLVRAAQREHDNIVAGERQLLVRSSNPAVLAQFATQQIPDLTAIPNLSKCMLTPQSGGVCQMDGMPAGVFVQYAHCHCNNEAVTLMIINTPNQPAGELVKNKFMAAQNADHNILSWHQSKDLLYIVVTKLPFDEALEVAEAVGR